MIETTRSLRAATGCPQCASPGWLRLCDDCADHPILRPEILLAECSGCGAQFDFDRAYIDPHYGTMLCPGCVSGWLSETRSERPEPTDCEPLYLFPPTVARIADGADLFEEEGAAP